jgi:protein OS-9
MTLHGRRYLCGIPRIPEDKEDANGGNATSADELEKELVRASDRGWELLKGMQGNCLYFMSGWWSYSFCYNEGVRQFHPLPPGRGVPYNPPVEDPTVPGFELGMYKSQKEKSRRKTGDLLDDGTVDSKADAAGQKKDRAETGLAKLETKGEVRYLVQKLNGGSICDLTGKDRKVEVQVSEPWRHCPPIDSHLMHV